MWLMCRKQNTLLIASGKTHSDRCDSHSQLDVPVSPGAKGSMGPTMDTGLEAMGFSPRTPTDSTYRLSSCNSAVGQSLHTVQLKPTCLIVHTLISPSVMVNGTRTGNVQKQTHGTRNSTIAVTSIWLLEQKNVTTTETETLSERTIAD